MTRDEARAMAALMLAYADGKTVQKCYCGLWADIDHPTFESEPSEYRIKPEPKDKWVNEYIDGSSLAYSSKEEAERFPSISSSRIAVHYREVCDE